MEPARKREPEKRRFLVMTPRKERRYTVADIEALPEGERAELIDGKMYLMASPTLDHQDILVWLSARIFNYIETHKGNCRVVPAPFGVYIKKDEHNFFEPDISVICDRDKLDQKGCHGAPDWVIEIVSPSSRRMDYRLKLPVYREAGVQEYWIVDYQKKIITVHFLQKPDTPVTYSFHDIIKPGIFAEFEIDFSQLSEYLR